MKIYSQTVDRCTECPGSFKFRGDPGIKSLWACKVAGEKQRQIENEDSIPDWCPLQDEAERVRRAFQLIDDALEATAIAIETIRFDYVYFGRNEQDMVARMRDRVAIEIRERKRNL